MAKNHNYGGPDFLNNTVKNGEFMEVVDCNGITTVSDKYKVKATSIDTPSPKNTAYHYPSWGKTSR